MGKNLYVGNLSFKATANDLRKLSARTERSPRPRSSSIAKPAATRFRLRGNGGRIARAAIDAFNGEEFQGPSPDSQRGASLAKTIMAAEEAAADTAVGTATAIEKSGGPGPPVLFAFNDPDRRDQSGFFRDLD